MRTLIATLLLLASLSPWARAQTVNAEVDTTAGYSTERVRAAGIQARMFGETKWGVRFFLEGSWATTTGTGSDAFGTAYPYDKRVRLIEAYGEKIIRRGAYVAGVRLGRYRTPFGIYGRSDYGYAGLLRAPLIRYDGYFALSNNFLEGGVELMGGTPLVQVQASVGVPQDPTDDRRQDGLNRVTRVQAYRGSWIVGASHIRTRPSRAFPFARGETVFTGIDVRWAHQGLQLRGEWITGRPFDGTTTAGWYIDGQVHRRAMGPLTAVARVERLDYEAGRFSIYPRRITAGTRIRLSEGLAAHLSVVHQPGGLSEGREMAVDVGLSYTARLTRP